MTSVYFLLISVYFTSYFAQYHKIRYGHNVPFVVMCHKYTLGGLGVFSAIHIYADSIRSHISAFICSYNEQVYQHNYTAERAPYTMTAECYLDNVRALPLIRYAYAPYSTTITFI